MISVFFFFFSFLIFNFKWELSRKFRKISISCLIKSTEEELVSTMTLVVEKVRNVASLPTHGNSYTTLLLGLKPHFPSALLIHTHLRVIDIHNQFK